MSKFNLTLYFSGMNNDDYAAFHVSTDWDINFDSDINFTNGQGESPPDLEKIWTYIEQDLIGFNLAKNHLSCQFHFSKNEKPIVVWRDPNQMGELLMVDSETNDDWWVVG